MMRKFFLYYLSSSYVSDGDYYDDDDGGGVRVHQKNIMFLLHQVPTVFIFISLARFCLILPSILGLLTFGCSRKLSGELSYALHVVTTTAVAKVTEKFSKHKFSLSAIE
jgi:hypothetical protein